jgi:hypothetical protein
LAQIAVKLGPLPHGRLYFNHGRPNRPGRRSGEEGGLEEGVYGPDTPKKQGARLLKAQCMTCGYVVRVTAKWLALGAPHCHRPQHGPMTVEGFGNGAGQGSAAQPNGLDHAHAGTNNGSIFAPMDGADLNKEQHDG